MYGPRSILEDHNQMASHSKESLSFDEVWYKEAQMYSCWIWIFWPWEQEGGLLFRVHMHVWYDEWNLITVSTILLQDIPTNSLVDDDVTSEASVADLSRFIPKIPSSPSVSHVISIGQLLESVIPCPPSKSCPLLWLSPCYKYAFVPRAYRLKSIMVSGTRGSRSSGRDFSLHISSPIWHHG